MDIVAALLASPYAGWVPYITFAVTVATALLLLLPAPVAGGSTVYLAVYNVVHVIANLKPAPGVKPVVPAATVVLLIAGGLALSACSPQQAEALAQVNTAICQSAATLQPVLVPLAASVATAVDPAGAPAIAGAVALDNTAIHPALQAACPAGSALIGALAKPAN